MKRRTLRLFPAFYVCWLFCWLVPGVPGRWWAFAYFMDFYNSFYALPGTSLDVMGMAWSLGIEEKYYLIWPTILQRFRHAALLKATLFLFGCAQLYHFCIYRLGHVMWAAWGLDTRIDAILLGSSLALAIKLGWLPAGWILTRASLTVSVSLVVILSGVTWVHRLGLGVLVAAYPLAIILLSVIARPPRLLNNGLALFFGKISYSLYLYNPLVVYLVEKITFLHGLWRTAATMSCAIVVASLSYHLVEKPFLRLRDRFRNEGQRNIVRKHENLANV